MGSWKTGPRHYEDFETGLCSVQVLECIVILGGGREEKLFRSKTFTKLSFMVCVCICMCVCVCVCVCVLLCGLVVGVICIQVVYICVTFVNCRKLKDIIFAIQDNLANL